MSRFPSHFPEFGASFTVPGAELYPQTLPAGLPSAAPPPRAPTLPFSAPCPRQQHSGGAIFLFLRALHPKPCWQTHTQHLNRPAIQHRPQPCKKNPIFSATIALLRSLLSTRSCCLPRHSTTAPSACLEQPPKPLHKRCCHPQQGLTPKPHTQPPRQVTKHPEDQTAVTQGAPPSPQHPTEGGSAPRHGSGPAAGTQQPSRALPSPTAAVSRKPSSGCL